MHRVLVLSLFAASIVSVASAQSTPQSTLLPAAPQSSTALHRPDHPIENISGAIGMVVEANAAVGASTQSLELRDMFVLPIGPLGLAPTARMLSLVGKRVRIVGHMVHEESATPGRFLLTSVPVQTSDVADGPADDLPAVTLYVTMPQQDVHRTLAHRRGLWVVEGLLEFGRNEEADGRVSYLRLKLDSSTPPTQEQQASSAVPERATVR